MTRPIPGDNLGLHASERGLHLYVSGRAALAFLRAADAEGPEEARRQLTELLLDARPAGTAGTGAQQWRARSRTTGLDVTAHVAEEGRLVVVVHVGVRGVAKRAPRAGP